MNRTQRILAGVAGMATLVVASAAFARPHGGCEGMGRGMGHAMMRGEPGAMAEQHLAQLKTDLKITAAQDAAWKTFATKAAEQAKAQQAAMQKIVAAAPAASAPLPAPDRMAQHLTLMKQRVAGMEAMQSAVKELYAVLTPEQRTLADRFMGHMGAGGHGDRGDRGHGERGSRDMHRRG